RTATIQSTRHARYPTTTSTAATSAPEAAWPAVARLAATIGPHTKAPPNRTRRAGPAAAKPWPVDPAENRLDPLSGMGHGKYTLTTLARPRATPNTATPKARAGTTMFQSPTRADRPAAAISPRMAATTARASFLPNRSEPMSSPAARLIQ